MIPSWAQRVYETDKVGAELCRDMQIAGFHFDKARALELSESLRQAEASARVRVEAAVGRALKPTKSGGISTKDLHDAVFHGLGAPVFYRSELTNAPSLGIDAMRGYAACSDERLAAFAVAELERRRARKIRVTYIDAPVYGKGKTSALGADGRVHPTWMNYGTVSGRYSCQGPNLMNLPTRHNDPTASVGGIRGLYGAQPGCVIVAFDAKQLEMRIAAYASGDEAMISACESQDLHASNAALIFGEEFAKAAPDHRDNLRSIAKQSGFAVCYLAEAVTVWTRIVAAGMRQVQLRQVEVMLRRLRKSFRGYYEWQDRRLLDCIREGWTDSPLLGRRRYLGHVPAATECANFPIQGGAADVMNIKLPEIVRRLRHAVPDARLVAQVHDSGVFEVPEAQSGDVLRVFGEVWAEPVDIDSSGCKLSMILPIDVKVKERWS